MAKSCAVCHESTYGDEVVHKFCYDQDLSEARAEIDDIDYWAAFEATVAEVRARWLPHCRAA
jgi:hypothetical protein